MQQQGIGITGATKQVTKSRKWATELYERYQFQRLVDLKWTNTNLSGNLYILKYIFSYSIMNVDEAVQFSFVQ